MCQQASDDLEELERLDDMHAGFSDYFGQELSLADIGSPKRILELGAGSGAWAIQAARKYPESEVTAVDVSPLPNRPVPTNMKFEQLDLRDDFPCTPGTFDVVHMRFVLLHMPNFPDVMQRAIDLIKPGGWLLVEDFDHIFYELNNEVGEGSKRLFSIINGYLEANGCDPYLGPTFERRLQEMNLFRHIHVDKIYCPVSPEPNAEPRSKAIGQTMRRSFLRVYPSFAKKISELTDEVTQAWLEEYNDPKKSYMFYVYAVSARKL